jgi:hypothetical protein
MISGEAGDEIHYSTITETINATLRMTTDLHLCPHSDTLYVTNRLFLLQNARPIEHFFGNVTWLQATHSFRVTASTNITKQRRTIQRT